MNEKIRKMLALAKEKATTALQAEDADEAKALVAEATALKAQADVLTEGAQLLGEISTPVMPAALPAAPDPAPAPGESPGDQALKAFYVLRYGDMDQEIKAVLTDLHGPEYHGKRWAQWGAFNRYLRGGEQAFKSGDANLLREIILTPDYAMQAIKSGRDIVAIKAVMVEARNTLGGWAVPVDWQADVIKRLMGLVVMRGRARMRSTTRDAMEYPVATGGGAQYSNAVRVTWVDETPTAGAAATNLTFGQERLPIHTVMAETFISQNNVEDAGFDLPDALADAFSEAAAIDEDNQFLTGDGAGKPEGVLPDSTNLGSRLSEATTGHATLVQWDGLIDLIYTPDSQYRGNCIFVGEKATYKAIAKLKDGNGQYLWRDRFGNNVSEGGDVVRLMGYEAYEQEAMPTIAANAYAMVFLDPKGYTIADRIGMTIRRYEDSETARINQICFVMRRRLGGQLTEPWRAACLKVSA
jgi:HK97 family phage major capsid protein